MLSYKRFKELKVRLKELTNLTRWSKHRIKYYSRIKDFKTLGITWVEYFRHKNELNLVIEILRLHKILYKQHLTTLNEFGNKC